MKNNIENIAKIKNKNSFKNITRRDFLKNLTNVISKESVLVIKKIF